MQQQKFFDFAADVGLTKHMGGIQATEELAQLTHISKGKCILDIGCGVGMTPCFLAKRYDCHVVGFDRVEAMVEKSKRRAMKEKCIDRVDFRVADAQELPFEDNFFDAVITESVTAFTEDQASAIKEYVRVVKPFGYVGLNESTWLKTPVPQELMAWVSQDESAGGKPLSADAWEALLIAAQLQNIIIKEYPIDVKEESKSLMRRYGLGNMLGILGRMFLLYFKNEAYRKFVRDVQKGGITPPNLDEYFGYGLYIGQKQASG